MKKKYRMGLNNRGSSPVVASLLMVAITVILTGMLYILVTTMFTGATGVNSMTPVGSMSLKEDSNIDSKSERVYIGAIRPAQPPTACKLMLCNETGKVATFSFPITDMSGEMGTENGITVNYMDNMDDKILSNGDYLTLTNLPTDTHYTLILIWIHNGGTICSVSFKK